MISSQFDFIEPIRITTKIKENCFVICIDTETRADVIGKIVDKNNEETRSEARALEVKKKPYLYRKIEKSGHLRQPSVRVFC